jgi:Na+/H+-translocating membrane pyrophosphatase
MLLFSQGAVLSNGAGCVCMAAAPAASLHCAAAATTTIALQLQRVMTACMLLAQAQPTAKCAAVDAYPVHWRSQLNCG